MPYRTATTCSSRHLGVQQAVSIVYAVSTACTDAAATRLHRSGVIAVAFVHTEDDDGKWVPVVAFECRGIEPTAFHPEVGMATWHTAKRCCKAGQRLVIRPVPRSCVSVQRPSSCSAYTVHFSDMVHVMLV